MSIITNGLVLKVNDVGESDRVVTMLTSDLGVIHCFANRAKKINGKINAATQSLCYGEFTIYTGKDSYIISSAEAKEVFFNLRSDITAVALAQYFCSLAIELIPEGEPAPQSLRVILNSLAFLQNKKRSADFIKAVTELKLLTLAGFAPAIGECNKCGDTGGGKGAFDTRNGKFCCEKCGNAGTKISAGVMMAMRHIVSSPVDRIYSFSVPLDDEKILMQICEEYLLNTLGKSFKTLDFYKGLL